MFDLLDNFIDLADKNVEREGIWREEVVDLVTFFKSEDFLNESPYDGKQTELLEIVNDILWYKLTSDETLCEEDFREITEIAVLFGKGSGKDFLASGILAYVCYMLCCLKDPQGYFGFGQDEPIDVINVAINAYQANNVFFKKLKARILNCKWFERVGSNPTESEDARHNQFQLTKNQIRFYKNITAHSAHSEADSFEGFNPFMVIFDEIGGFEEEAAEDIYSMFRSSALSRYNKKMLLMFISYPRHEKDMMMQKAKESATDPEVYLITGKSWEVNPSIKRESLEKDYIRDPEGAQLKYECIPPKYIDGLFKFPEKIDEAVVVGRESQCPNLIMEDIITTRTISGGMEKHFVGKVLHNLELNPAHVYYLGGDCATHNDSYVLCLVHGEPTMVREMVNGEPVERWVNKPIEDLLIEWRPNAKDRLPVDMLNVADVIEQICQQVYVKKALFDKFNSADVVQRLMCYGVDAEDKNFSNPFQLQLYTNLKSLIYTRNIELLDHTLPLYPENDNRLNANDELKHLKLINGNKIDHDPKYAKDFSDARAGATYICSMDTDIGGMENFAMPSIMGLKI